MGHVQPNRTIRRGGGEVRASRAGRETIEETINAMFDEEVDQLVGAAPYERTGGRAAYRAGHYERVFTTTSGQATLKMPKLKGMRFATAVVKCLDWLH